MNGVWTTLYLVNILSFMAVVYDGATVAILRGMKPVQIKEKIT